ncbi:MAG: TetR family transcriptional regulator [Chitinophaga sp.]|uniref:TetR/AcrR family transcriptional regulator n=1 Tax=Chitinophaga sp. TaxID=1869181 RepID=UPI001B20987C|nr:TetR/AcrR family transcriptional regulator [Chitinophaga sp.]MBO9729243.1 TetR family transcriptional regulator [Chitinophaga sp.]
METKERILKTALDLYNEQGVHTITSRHIAAEMGISAGNLHYHFKHTDEIIQTLYNRLAVGFDAIMAAVGAASDINLDIMKEFVSRSLELTYKYRFIFLHFVEIGLRIPAIRKDYHALTQRREKEFLAIFDKFKADGIFKQDIPASVLEALVTQIFIMGDFWLSNNELTGKLKGSKAIAYYSGIFASMFYPYLTKAAQQLMYDAN